MTCQRVHGGTDALGPARFDFSTNSNACGPCPAALASVAQADPTRYPDPNYTVLREELAGFHGVDASRITLAGSASEFVFRMTALAARNGATAVTVPSHGYGDYTHAALGWGLQATTQISSHLVWACEPSSPLGQAHGTWPDWLLQANLPESSTGVESLASVVLDCAYAPLRLRGAPSLSVAQRERVWQLWSPNKALGLTGLRAAYAIAPEGRESQVEQLEALAPSWPIGAHGEAMLMAWPSLEVQVWLAQSLAVLRNWRVAQVAMLQSLHWQCASGDANFFCARPPHPLDFPALRMHGIKLRDAGSFGLPGWVRLGVQTPQAQAALLQALQSAVPIDSAAHRPQQKES